MDSTFKILVAITTNKLIGTLVRIKNQAVFLGSRNVTFALKINKTPAFNCKKQCSKLETSHDPKSAAE